MQSNQVKSHTKLLVSGMLIGFVFALLIAAIPTIVDWYGNPGTIFRDASGTNWCVVFETLVSWFWPAFFVTAPISLAILGFISFRGSSNAT